MHEKSFITSGPWSLPIILLVNIDDMIFFVLFYFEGFDGSILFSSRDLH